MNFGAGMTGGLAWVYDGDGKFIQRKRFHPDFIEPIAFAQASIAEQEQLKALITRHADVSESSLAAVMLANWSEKSAAFVMLSPKPQA
jgi:glutamate synthase (NADPH/NADH) large chain